MSEDSLFGSGHRLRPKSVSFRRTPYRLPVHLAKTHRLIWLSFCQVGKVGL